MFPTLDASFAEVQSGAGDDPATGFADLKGSSVRACSVASTERAVVLLSARFSCIWFWWSSVAKQFSVPPSRMPNTLALRSGVVSPHAFVRALGNAGRHSSSSVMAGGLFEVQRLHPSSGTEGVFSDLLPQANDAAPSTDLGKETKFKEIVRAGSFLRIFALGRDRRSGKESHFVRSGFVAFVVRDELTARL